MIGGFAAHPSADSILKGVLKRSGENHWTYGKPRSEETKEKLRNNKNIKKKGRKHPPEFGEQISKRQMGANNPNFGEKDRTEANIKRSLATKGIPHSEERKKSTREKKALLPKRPMLESTKEKLRGPQRKVTCPHCDVTGGICVMQRYHFDRCKFKPE